MSLPDEVLALADHKPAEDLGLAIIRAGLPDEVEVVSQIRRDQDFPCVLVRQLPTFTGVNLDERFLTAGDLSIHVFTEGVNADEEASILSIACHRLLRAAWLQHTFFPGMGSVKKVEVDAHPRRVPDWATSSGPVQYADLPSNVTRYEGRYRLVVRKPRNPPYAP